MKKTNGLVLCGLFILFFQTGLWAKANIITFAKGKAIEISGERDKTKTILFYNSTVEDAKKAYLFKVGIKIKNKVGTDTGDILADDVIDEIGNQLSKVKGVPVQAIKFIWGDQDGNPMGLLPEGLQAFSTGTTEYGVAEAGQGDSVRTNKVLKKYPTRGEAKDALINEIHLDFVKRAAAKYVMIVFDEDLKPIEIWPETSAVGDLIYIGVLRKVAPEISPENKHFEIEFSPCSLEPESPQLYIGDTHALDILKAATEGYEEFFFDPRRCFNSTVDITIKAGESKSSITVTGHYQLRQYNRYRGTLQLGTLFTDQHEVSFGLTTKDGKNVIYNKGPINNGPEYTVSLVLYSIFRYVEDLFSSGTRHYSGRDIVNDRSLIDCLGGIVGVGLNNPGNRFVLGLSFEPIYGVNLIGVVDFARMNELGAGLSEGSEFSGAEETLPIRHFWSRRFVLGISLDLRYVTAIFSKK
jgi:hypothetical protein